MIWSVLSFVAGLVLLGGAAELLVRGSVSLAGRAGVSPLVIGLTVVAFGTSAPELVVCIRAALAGAPGIAYGNVVGSNIANILLILGVAGLLRPVACVTPGLARSTGVMVAATALFAALALTGVLLWWQGVVLLALLALYLFDAYRRERQGIAATPFSEEVEDLGTMTRRPLPLLVLAVLGGLAGVVAGAELLVGGAVDVARALGVGEEVIGLTLVAVGTSLPELAAAIAAARHGHDDLTVGNVVGSNIFNILGILGATALVRPLPVPPGILAVDLWALGAVTLVLVPFVVGRMRLGRGVAAGFLTVYGAYVAFQFIAVDTPA